MSAPDFTPKVLLRGEESGGAVSVIQSRLPAHWPGPPLHLHDFDEGFYVVEGELTFQLRDELLTARAGDFVFAPRGVPHTFANLSHAPSRHVLVITPAGFERYFARIAAEQAGVEPPEWALQPTPEVTRVGPQIGKEES